MNPNTLSRRVLLKGLGLSVSLPWLEAAHLWGGEFTKPSTRPPQRFACMFIGDGISPPQWWSKGDGAAMELGESLTSLAPHKDKLNVINGLFNQQAGGGHARCAGNILSGVALRRGREIHGGISMDQLLAKQFEEETALPSLVLGCERLSRKPVLDGLRLAHLLAKPELADSDRALSFARVR